MEGGGVATPLRWLVHLDGHLLALPRPQVHVACGSSVPCHVAKRVGHAAASHHTSARRSDHGSRHERAGQPRTKAAPADEACEREGRFALLLGDVHGAALGVHADVGHPGQLPGHHLVQLPVVVHEGIQVLWAAAQRRVQHSEGWRRGRQQQRSAGPSRGLRALRRSARMHACAPLTAPTELCLRLQRRGQCRAQGGCMCGQCGACARGARACMHAAACACARAPAPAGPVAAGPACACTGPVVAAAGPPAAPPAGAGRRRAVPVGPIPIQIMLRKAHCLVPCRGRRRRWHLAERCRWQQGLAGRWLQGQGQAHIAGAAAGGWRASGSVRCRVLPTSAVGWALLLQTGVFCRRQALAHRGPGRDASGGVAWLGRVCGKGARHGMTATRARDGVVARGGRSTCVQVLQCCPLVGNI